jgi:hypothetical protein
VVDWSLVRRGSWPGRSTLTEGCGQDNDTGVCWTGLHGGSEAGTAAMCGVRWLGSQADVGQAAGWRQVGY